MEEIAPVWYILTGDRILLDNKEFEVLDKNLVPLGNEVGFCLNVKEVGSVERSWQSFREVLTGKHQTIEYVSGTILDVVTDIREED